MPQEPAAPTAARLLELIDAMAGRPVVMLVDLVADRFITGTPKRISREAPVLILRYDSEQLAPGGGANAAANVAALGGKPIPIGVVGNDQNGRDLLEALERFGVSVSGILTRRGYRTPTKTRILGGATHAIKQQIVRYDIEQQFELTAEERRTIIGLVKNRGADARVAVFSDYGYGAAVPDLVASVRGALGRRCQVIADSRHRLGEFAGLDGATPNQEEAEAILQESIGDDRQRLIAGGKELLRRLGGRFVLVTRGSRGMALFLPDSAALLPVHGTDQVADVTGAGDTVIGTVALALAAGATALEAAALANYAGGVVVMKTGTATLSRLELKAAVEANPVPREGLEWVRF